MNLNTLLLILLVISSYLNLYLTVKRLQKRKTKTKTKLPISSKEWREKIEDENFKSWLSSRQRLKDKSKGDLNH